MRVWIASLLFYLFVFTVCELLRLVINRWFAPRLPRLTTGLLLEITVIEIANCLFLRDAIAHPCPLVITASRKRSTLNRMFIIFVVQLSAAYLSHFLARTFWRFNLHHAHNELLNADYCEADLTVALTVGATIEGLATFCTKAVEYIANEWYVDSNAQMLITCLFAGFMTSVGINYTGMYANPIVAWACTFNCEGITHFGHLIVYWLSPLIGWYLADIIFGDQQSIPAHISDDGSESKKLKSR
ncbi:unnamed protein product [Thelazia callipaeda]|uniref:Aquaporin n=1 Tax=Thelazia callipaeda TaxID=103827 RepID=A0A0N5D252_THECL|nr:unnamed protein product [Thelazia callipaeda]